MFAIKKVNIIFIIFSVLLLLSACERTKSEEIIKNEIFTIEDIRFEDNRIFIDTEQETFVYSYGLTFRKTHEPSYINFKVVEKRKWYNWSFNFGEYPKKETIDVFINENSVKDISKKYANEFKETLSFSEDSK